VASTPAAERLEQALARLAASVGPEDLTVSGLCQLASISRNSLYRYHPDVLRTLRELQRAHPRTEHPRVRELVNRQRAELAELRQQVPKLAALVDHYYAAYCEAQALLTRREQEIAELRRRLDSKPVTIAR
jgi:AcrR family transcriptional regulator